MLGIYGSAFESVRYNDYNGHDKITEQLEKEFNERTYDLEEKARRIFYDSDYMTDAECERINTDWDNLPMLDFDDYVTIASYEYGMGSAEIALDDYIWALEQFIEEWGTRVKRAKANA